MSSCKDCLHYEACTDMLENLGYTVDGDGCGTDKRCKCFTARSEWMHLPCKVGDTVYYTSGKYYNDIIKCRVVAIEQNEKEMIIKTQSWDKLPNISLLQRHDRWFRKDDFFKTVFLTREEAEKALKGGAV